MVERQPSKLNVAGSSPVSRSEVIEKTSKIAIANQKKIGFS
jgi:hypothetical protein